MKKLPLIALFALAASVCAAQGTLPKGVKPNLVEVGKGYSRNSVNTTIFRHNSVVTHRNMQYIAYYDGDSYVVVGKRRLGATEWELQRSQYKGNTLDAHNGISMMVDGDGYLHLSWDHHGHPLRYCRSVAPGSLSLGEKESMTGQEEQRVTYPEFYRFEDGGLLFVYRTGGSGNGNIVMNRYDLLTRKWERVQDVVVDGEGQRNAYWQLCIDSQGTIHLSWVWREAPDVASNRDLCYARSRDKGRTWERSNGTAYTMPITAATAEYACRIPQRSELINQTSMTADRDGRPYIVSYWRDQDSTVPQYRLVWLDNGQWRQQQIGQRTTPFSLSGGGTKKIPISRPRLVVAQQGKRLAAYCIFRDEERGAKVSMAWTPDLAAGTWSVGDLTDFAVDAWEPSHDTELWKERQKLHVYVQKTGQGDGETSTDMEPQPVYVLEVID